MNRLSRFLLGISFCGALLASAATTARADLVNLGPGSFTPLATTITFSEFPINTQNPVYNFAAVPDLGNVQVSFRGHFVGQAAGGFPVTLTDNTPTRPLA